MLSIMLQESRIALDEREARSLAEAIANVQRHYKAELAATTVDWINLAQVAAMIYGTRFVAIARSRKERRTQVEPLHPMVDDATTQAAWPAH